jgi:prepilin-type processing-associated H-X9-DG protein
MTRFAVRAAATAAAVVFALPAAAQPPVLKKVPADAAVVVHVDVATLWPSKLGEALRSAKALELEKALARIKAESGITPDMVKSVTLFFPQLKQPGDFEAPVIHTVFLKPYDRAKVLDGLKKQMSKDDKLTETEPGVYELIPARDRGGENTEGEAAFTFDMTSPTAAVMAGKGMRKYLKDAPAAADGPLAPALKAAADGATAVLGINFAALPDEIRGEDVPAEVRPFQPLFKSDALIATGRLDGDTIKLDVRFRSQERAKTAEAEKSLAAGLFLAQTALGAAIKELEREKQEELKALAPLAKEVAEVLKTVKIAVDGPDAVATATMKTDLPVGPFLQTMFGGQAGPRAAAGRAKDQNNLKQIGLALHNYHDTYEGFPPAALVDRRGKPMLSWRVMILPFVEQDELYKQFRLDEPWDSAHNKKVFESNPMPEVFALPGVAKDGEKLTHYQAFVGNGAIFDPIQTCKIQSITDGTSNTLMVATAAKGVPWTKPDDIPFDPKADPRTLMHMADGGCSVAFADGSVRFLSKMIDPEVLKAVITKAGGEVTGDLP